MKLLTCKCATRECTFGRAHAGDCSDILGENDSSNAHARQSPRYTPYDASTAPLQQSPGSSTPASILQRGSIIPNPRGPVLRTGRHDSENAVLDPVLFGLNHVAEPRQNPTDNVEARNRDHHSGGEETDEDVHSKSSTPSVLTS